MSKICSDTVNDSSTLAHLSLAIKAILVDDELASRNTLRNLLEAHCPAVQVVGIATNVQEAQFLIASCDPDLVFLDISMPGGTGFDLLAAVGQRRFQVVFVTGHEEFAVRAFRASAVDYLLKPVALEELVEALAKVSQVLRAGAGAKGGDRLGQLKESLHTRRIERLALQKLQGVDLVEIQDISHLEADLNYTRFHLAQGKKIVACHTLKYFEEFLEAEGFYRIHRSYLVNLRQMGAFTQSPVMEVVMKNGTRLEVSRRRAPGLQQELSKWNPSA